MTHPYIVHPQGIIYNFKTLPISGTAFPVASVDNDNLAAYQAVTFTRTDHDNGVGVGYQIAPDLSTWQPVRSLQSVATYTDLLNLTPWDNRVANIADVGYTALYDGTLTRWVSAELFSYDFGRNDATVSVGNLIPPQGVNGLSAGGYTLPIGFAGRILVSVMVRINTGYTGTVTLSLANAGAVERDFVYTGNSLAILNLNDFLVGVDRFRPRVTGLTNGTTNDMIVHITARIAFT